MLIMRVSQTALALGILSVLPCLAHGKPLWTRDDATGASIPQGDTTYADPPGNVRRLHPYGRSDLCLGPVTVPPNPNDDLGLFSCLNNKDAYEYGNIEFWNVIDQGLGRIELNGTGLCIDAGDLKKPGTTASLQKCGDVATQQIKYEGGAIKFVGTTLCLEVETEGDAATNGHPPMVIYRNVRSGQCGDYPKNQIFKLYKPGETSATGPASSGQATSTTASSTDSSEGSGATGGQTTTTGVAATGTKTCKAKRAMPTAV